MANAAPRKHIVLLGGGHANALALLQLAKQNRHKITLVSEDKHTPYSGMLPGYIAGYYRRGECLIDLQATAQKHNIPFVCGRAIGLTNSDILLKNGDKISFDLLSINCGATPRPAFDGADSEAGQCIKPIAPFMDWLENLNAKKDSGDSHCVVIGGGAGGVETALALSRRFKKSNITLIAARLLPAFPTPARERLALCLAHNNINLITARANAYKHRGDSGGEIQLDNGQTIAAANIIITTGVMPPAWLDNTPLPRAEDGFIPVHPTLQTTTAPHIFATGDIAAHPHPTQKSGVMAQKSGVMAVRQAPTLTHNLLAQADSQNSTPPLSQWHTPPAPLYIVGTADDKAVACYKHRTFSGRWVWHWKQYLDQKFMRRFVRM